MNNALEVIRPEVDPRALALPGGLAGRGAPTRDRLDLNALITTIRRRRGLFLSIFLAVLGLAVALTLIQTPLYTTTARVVLNMRQEQIAPIAKAAAPMAPADRVDTEVEVLKSRALAERVVSTLDLVHDPAFDPARATPGIKDRVKALLGRTPPAAADPKDAYAALVERVMGMLAVARIGETYAMEITITTTSPAAAARIANEYARQYTFGQLDDKLKENQVASSFLAKRLEELRVQAQADTGRVQQYRLAHNLLSTSGASLTEQEISTYNTSVAEARAQAAEDAARLATARAQLRRGSSGDDVGEALGSPVVSALRTQQAQVSANLAALGARLGNRHPDVIRAKDELADVDGRIQAEIGRVVSNLEAKAQVSAQRLGSISGSLAGARGSLAQNNNALTGLDDLQRRAQASQGLYESYLNRYKETVAQVGTERPDSTIIALAETPSRQSSPRIVLNVVLGLVLGLGLGLAAAFIAEMMFTGLTTGDEIEQAFGLPYLAGIPTLSSVLPRGGPVNDAVVSHPRSAFAETFRTLRTSIDQTNAQPAQLVVVTSALPKEGKTTIATCLARTMAIDGERVLLIDADLARAWLSRRILTRERTIGLVEVLQGKATLEEAIFHDANGNVDVLPLTRGSGGAGDILTGGAFTELLAIARQRYGYIVIDTAPVLPIAETRVIAAMADAVVFVARWRSTADHAVRAALHLLPRQCAYRTGILLSRINMRQQVRFGRGDASCYYEQYKDYYD